MEKAAWYVWQFDDNRVVASCDWKKRRCGGSRKCWTSSMWRRAGCASGVSEEEFVRQMRGSGGAALTALARHSGAWALGAGRCACKRRARAGAPHWARQRQAAAIPAPHTCARLKYSPVKAPHGKSRRALSARRPPKKTPQNSARVPPRCASDERVNALNQTGGARCSSPDSAPPPPPTPL